jgi:ATP-dependent Clp protease adaptor protein ClpS
MSFKLKEDLQIDEEIITDSPKAYCIIIFNNPITAFEAVLDVLTKVFNKSEAQASKIMIDAHNHGRAVVVVPISKEMAFAKIKMAAHYCKSKDSQPSHTFYNQNYSQLKFTAEEV